MDPFGFPAWYHLTNGISSHMHFLYHFCHHRSIRQLLCASTRRVAYLGKWWKMYVRSSIIKNVLHFGRDRSSGVWLCYQLILVRALAFVFEYASFAHKKIFYLKLFNITNQKSWAFWYLIYVKAPLEEHFHYYSCSIKRKIWHRAWKSTRHCRASRQLGKIHLKEKVSFEIRC